jgi:hypothetical protein
VLQQGQAAALHPGALAWREPWGRQSVGELAGDREAVERSHRQEQAIVGLVARGVQQVILEQLAWGVRLGEGGHRLEGVRPLVQRVHPLLERLGRCTMSPRSESRWE